MFVIDPYFEASVLPQLAQKRPGVKVLVVRRGLKVKCDAGGGGDGGRIGWALSFIPCSWHCMTSKSGIRVLASEFVRILAGVV